MNETRKKPDPAELAEEDLQEIAGGFGKIPETPAPPAPPVPIPYPN